MMRWQDGKQNSEDGGQRTEDRGHALLDAGEYISSALFLYKAIKVVYAKMPRSATVVHKRKAVVNAITNKLQ